MMAGRGMLHRAFVCLLSFGFAILSLDTVWALINPNFTPVELVEQADLIVRLELGPMEGSVLPVRILETLQGDEPEGDYSINLAGTDKPLVAELRAEFRGGVKTSAMLFQGEFAEEGDGGMGEDEGAAMLHVGSRWFAMVRTDDAWILEPDPQDLLAVWAGGEDLMPRVVDYVLNDPYPIVPVAVEATWAGFRKAATVSGKVNGVQAVDPTGDGDLGLFVLCEGGDRFFQFDSSKKELVDRTAALKLGSKSRSAAWADFNADGRLDLASWEGGSLSVWLQSREGSLERKAGEKLKKGCVGLSVVAAGGRPAILVGTSGVPGVVSLADSGAILQPRPMVKISDEFPGAKFGGAGACLVADFDGDSRPDVLQPFESGTLLYRGKGQGAFEPPRTVAGVALGKDAAAAFTGDYDADGLLDVYVVGKAGCSLWHNLGGGRFIEALEAAGEVAYITKPNAIGGATCDINNDGRQDVMIAYSQMSAQMFFNRGFRCFGYAIEMDLIESNTLPNAGEGQQAGTVADLNGDGGPDLALVLTNGDVVICLRDVEESNALAVRAAVPAGTPGPVNVTAWSEERCLGAWNVAPGGEAFFGKEDPGPCRLKWRVPGGGVRERTVVVESKPVRVPLD